MAETESGQSEGQAAPASAPVSPSTEEIRAMVAAEAQRIVNERIPGLQAAYDTQIASLNKKLKAAQADPDGYNTSVNAQLEADLAQARREADALRAGRQFPDAYPLFEAMTSADTVEDQLALLQQAIRPVATPPAAPQEPARPEPPSSAPVDLNRPLPTTPSGATGPAMDKATADAIIDAFDSWPQFGG